jgi:hypothetical protein
MLPDELLFARKACPTLHLPKSMPRAANFFGLPCSSTTSFFEPGGKTCSDFKNEGVL